MQVPGYHLACADEILKPCVQSAVSGSKAPRLSRRINHRGAYTLEQLKTDWIQALQYWVQKYEALHRIPTYFERGFHGILGIRMGLESMTVLRLTYSKRLLDRLDSLGNFCHRTTRAISVPTISANRLLPQKSVWSFRRRIPAAVQPSLAEHTPEPKMSLQKEHRRALE